MIKIQLTSVKYGMKLAKPIYTSEGKLLIDKGVLLKDSYVYKLLNFGINEVFVEWNRGEQIPEYVEAITYEIQEGTKDIMTEIVEGIQLSKKIDSGEVKELVNKVLERLLNNKNTILCLADLRTLDNYTFEHSLNVCLYSLIIGVALKYDIEKLESLGVGALLHDIGKLVIPIDVLNKPSRLNDEEYKVIKQHVVDGLKLLDNISDIDEGVRVIVSDHHERYDGKGYPFGKQGRAIHEFARIVAICDVYDALTSDRVYKKRIPIHQAVEYLISMGNHQFDYALVKIFISQLAIYPEGTFIKLDTGQIAEVIKENQHWPTRPLVAIKHNKHGQQLKEFINVDLSKHLNIGIVHTI